MHGQDRRQSRSPSVHGRPPASAQRDPNDDGVLRLQTTAGNRAVTEALGPLPVQRAPKPKAAPANTGGELRIAGGKPIRFKTATWSISAKTQADTMGRQRRPTLVPGAVQLGDIVITRDADDRSDAMAELFDRQVGGGPGSEELDVTIRLDRASTDGRLPAAELALKGVLATRFSVTPGEPALETVALSPESLAIAGKSGSAPRDASGSLELGPSGGEPWLPMPVLEWSVARPGEDVIAPGGGSAGRMTKLTQSDTPTRVRAKVAPGPALEQLASGIQSQLRVTAVYRDRSGREEQFVDALFERLESTSDGPGVVVLELVAEQSRTTPPARR